MNFTNTAPKNEYVFIEDPRSKEVKAMAGKVHHEATIQPVIDDEYRKIMQSRTIEATTTSRGVKIMDKTAGKNQQFIVPNLTNRDTGFGLLVRNQINVLHLIIIL